MKNTTIFHVHTYRCRHSDIKPAELVLVAKELNVRDVWFSDHCPFPENPFRCRMQLEELKAYVQELRELQKKYEEHMNIHIGLEAEFLPIYRQYYDELMDSGIEFLLLGPHFAELPDGSYTFQNNRREEHKYLAESMMQGMETGLFYAVSHPDQIYRKMKRWSYTEELLSMDIKECAARTGVLLEQNLANMSGRKQRAYRSEFWINVPVDLKTVFGSDLHFIREIEESYYLQQKLINNV